MAYRIFIVEDHPIMREAYARVLAREADLELCGMAASAEEALGALDAAACDLLVADVSLPGMDGIEMIERLRARHPDLPTLVISGHDDPLFVRRALRAGALAFVSKQELAGKFPETIRDALRSNGASGGKEAAAHS